MRWLLIVLGVLAGLLVLALVVGALLPRDHRVTSRIVLRQPPDSVWAAIRDLGGAPRFWPALRASERQPDPAGREVWRQTMTSGFAMTISVAEESPPGRLVTAIEAGPGAPFGGRWIYEIAPGPAGTEVTVTEEGWVANPLFRLVSRVAGQHGTLDGYLRALGARFGEPAEPRHLP